MTLNFLSIMAWKRVNHITTCMCMGKKSWDSFTWWKGERCRINESMFLSMRAPSRKQTHPRLSHNRSVFFSQRAECDLKQESTVHFLHVWGSTAAQRKPWGTNKVRRSERVTSPVLNGKLFPLYSINNNAYWPGLSLLEWKEFLLYMLSEYILCM